MKKGLSDKVIKRVELIESTNIFDALERRYFCEQLSYRKICKLWGVNNRTVAKIITYCGKEARHGGEAVKTQWINATDRRKQAGKVLSDMNHNLALKGLHVRQGKNKSNSQLIRDIAEKLKVSSSFHRKDVKAKALKNSLKTRRLHPERNGFLKTPPTKREQLIINFLEKEKIKYSFRFIIDVFIVNFYLPDYNLCIDLQGKGSFPLSFHRHKSILDKGYRITYCISNFVDKSSFGDLHDYITSIDTVSSKPALIGEKTVVWGARNRSIFGSKHNKITAERVRVGSFNTLHFTTPSD